jgi:hypothetical protein
MKIEIMTLILALIQIESGGNDKAIGDSGKAYGCLQIHDKYVADVAWASGIPYAHEEAFDRQKAIDMFLIYMSLYATEGRLNREPTAQDMARIHHGGPDGWKKPHTLKYWEKVKAILDADTSL